MVFRLALIQGPTTWKALADAPMNLSTEEVENLLLYQIGALDAFARAAGGRIRHIKPHGWLYNEAAKNANFAQVIAGTVRSLNPEWILFGAAGSQLIAAAKAARIPFAEEAFADRTYEIDGSLTPRSQPGSLITDPAQAARQCLDIVLKGKLKTTRGRKYPFMPIRFAFMETILRHYLS